MGSSHFIDGKDARELIPTIQETPNCCMDTQKVARGMKRSQYTVAKFSGLTGFLMFELVRTEARLKVENL